jgi:hypothetical protein
VVCNKESAKQGRAEGKSAANQSAKAEQESGAEDEATVTTITTTTTTTTTTTYPPLWTTLPALATALSPTTKGRTYLVTSHKAGDTSLNVASTDGFSAGHKIKIDSGTAHEEVNEVAEEPKPANSFLQTVSLVVKYPIANDHVQGAIVEVLPEEAPAAMDAALNASANASVISGTQQAETATGDCANASLPARVNSSCNITITISPIPPPTSSHETQSSSPFPATRMNGTKMANVTEMVNRSMVNGSIAYGKNATKEAEIQRLKEKLARLEAGLQGLMLTRASEGI